MTKPRFGTTNHKNTKVLRYDDTHLQKKYSINGKIRTNENKLAKGYKVEAFDSDYLTRDDFLGESKVKPDGTFRIEFNDTDFSEFWTEGRPDIILKIFDKSGKLLQETNVKKTHKEIEYQILLGIKKPDLKNQDIYSDNLAKIISMMQDVGIMMDREYQINLSTLNSERIPQEIKQRFERFLAGHQQRVSNLETLSKLVNGLLYSELNRRNLKLIEYDGAMVPSRPHFEIHDHVISWIRKE